MKNDLLQKCKLNQKLYEKVLKDLQDIRKMNKKITKINKRHKQLSSFYHGEWIDLVDAFASDDVDFEILNQDSIYNALIDQYNEIKKLLNKCSNFIL